MKVLSNEDYDKLVTEKREAAKGKKAENTKLKTELKTLELKIERNTEKHERDLEKKALEFDRLKEELQAYKNLENDSLATKSLEIELQRRERVLKAKEEGYTALEKEIAATAKKMEEAREEGIKKGYADGLADGLREATKITAEDRKMMAQIAALAASSHTPDAATEIAKQVLKDATYALPATTKKR